MGGFLGTTYHETSFRRGREDGGNLLIPARAYISTYKAAAWLPVSALPESEETAVQFILARALDVLGT